jgi:class 3 adenylate cyclase
MIPRPSQPTDLLTATALMSDIHCYRAIAETADPVRLKAQLNDHRRPMNDAVLAPGGTVMAVFGASEPLDDHDEQALAAAAPMRASQRALNTTWISQGARLRARPRERKRENRWLRDAACIAGQR